VNYLGDYNFNAASTSLTYTVAKSATSMIVTPAQPSITTAQSLAVGVLVNGATGPVPPTGTVTLTSGTYTSPATSLNGSATITIPAGTLPVGTDTLNVTYSGDANYNTATGTGSVTVNAIPPTFTVAVPPSPSAHPAHPLEIPPRSP